MNRKVDYILIGQGIAGSMMAYFLLKKGKKIIVIDKFNPNASSNIAAGVVNPVTGRKMVTTWMIDDVLPFAKETYKILEQELDTSFFFDTEIYKIFSSKEDADIWERKRKETEYEHYLGEIVYFEENSIKAPFGAGIIKQCCWMDVPKFTKAYRSLLLQNNILLEEEFEFSQLKVSEEISYKNLKADNIIFCEGYRAHLNPFFKWIPFALAKGEYLLVNAENLKTDKILSKNIFIIPKGNNLYNVGSTFIWDDVQETVTDVGRKEIVDKLNKMIAVDYRIADEKAGIRPAMPDRRPVIGRHPDYPNMYIFNGMGTKGVSLSPYFANYFANNLDDNSEIFREISVKRFEL
jgi:glycine/D-amino acid oxidase-like deaminating enzyme